MSVFHLLEEAKQELLPCSVGRVEARDGLVEDVGVESAAGGGQSTQGSQDEAWLLTRHRLLNLLHVLLNIYREQKHAKHTKHVRECVYANQAKSNP